MDRQDDYKWESSMELAQREAEKASEFFDDGKLELALEATEKAISINPANSCWHFDRALTLDSLGRYDQAIKEYQLVLDSNPEDLEILNCLGINLMRTGQYNLALEVFEEIQKIDSQYEKSFCNRIILYGEIGNFEMAEQMFYLAQQIKPDCALCFYNMGTILFSRKEYQKTIRCWLRTAEIEPTHPGINHYLAQAYCCDGSVVKTREYFLKENRLNPGNTEAIFDFGLLELELGNTEAAKIKFSWINEIWPEFTPALFYLGELAFNNKDYDQAEILYKKALDQDPNMEGVRYRLACCKFIKGLKTEARAYLLDELKFNNGDGQIMVSIGSISLNCNDFELATHCLLRAVDFDFNNAEAYYYLALVATKKGEFEDALDLLSHSLDLRPGRTLFLQTKAFVYSMAGKLKEAEELVGKLIETESTPWLVRFRKKIHSARSENREKQRSILSKTEQGALSRVSSIIYEVSWCPCDGRTNQKKAEPNSIPLMVRKANWRG